MACRPGGHGTRVRSARADGRLHDRHPRARPAALHAALRREPAGRRHRSGVDPRHRQRQRRP
ncbi:MAG: hypothetical protein E6H79_19030, partial [Betaproteobacteria bacterium]